MYLHTPGPWIATSYWNGDQLDFSLASPELGRRNREDYKRFVTGTIWVNGLDCREGDLAMIAAAPELLEALREVFDDGLATNMAAWRRKAAAAILKATGG